MHEMIIQGKVTIKQGDKIIVKDAINHFVDAGLKGILSTMLFSRMGSSDSYWRLWAYSWNIYLGSDTATTTSTTMTSLVSPIGTAPGTPPDSKTISVKDGSADGVWEITYTATWNAGSVSGTVGELALYLKAPDKTDFRWEFLAVADYDPSEVMVSRLSSADGDFSSFIIDETKPLTVDWKVTFSFA